MATRAWLTGFLLLAVLDLASELLGWVPGTLLGLALAVPLLTGALLSSGLQHTRTGRWLLVGFVCSWLGDVLGWLVLIKIGFFLLAQIAYLVAFWPYRRRIVRPWLLALPYLAVITAVIVIIGWSAGSLLPAVVVYAGAVGSMAVLAHGVHPAAAVGGAVFVISDSLIGYDEFVTVVPHPALDALIMATYLGAQLLLLLGVRRATDRSGGREGIDLATGGSEP